MWVSCNNRIKKHSLLIYHFTKELCAFTNLPQPLPQPYFLSLPSALALPHPLLATFWVHKTTSHQKVPSSFTFFFLLQLLHQLLSFICNTYAQFSRLTSGSVSFLRSSLLDPSPVSLAPTNGFSSVCLLRALILE